MGALLCLLLTGSVVCPAFNPPTTPASIPSPTPVTKPPIATPPTKPPVPPTPNIWQPPPKTTWQWQLTGTIDTSVAAQVYDIDLFDTPQDTIDKLHAAGRKVICYFSAGSYEDWRDDANEFTPAMLGRGLSGWPGENWLDHRREDVRRIMEARIELAAQKLCDGVEPDNIDGYTNNSGFPLTANDQLAYNRWLATTAHKHGLSVGLKNDVDQVLDLVSYFDFAVNEECYQYDECEELLPFIKAGKAVFGVEYEGSPSTFCPYFNSMGFSWLKKDYDLLATPRIDCKDF